MDKGTTVIVKRPADPDAHPVGWLPEMDRFADKIFRIEDSMDWSVDRSVKLYELSGAQPYLFIEAWLQKAEFRGFCDKCGGFRSHRKGCP
jgi:hypothetical protein